MAKDGRRIDISLTISPVRDDTGRVIGASKVARDITERKRAEAERRRLQEEVEAERARLAEVFHRAPSFLAILRGPEHVFELANARYYQLIGKRDILGKPARAALPEFAGQGFFELLDRVYQSGEVVVGTDMRVMVQREPGQPLEARFIEFVYQPLRAVDGSVSGILTQGVDQTDRKRAEEALREADRRKEEFLALLAHELRNPLAPLRNGLHVMRLAGGDARAIAEARAMMERQLGHMVRLIDDLLDISRISQNKIELRRARVLLGEIINYALESARPAIEAGGHDLAVSMPTEPVWLDADLTRLAQVFSNLLTNSAKYTEPGGRIWLTAVAGGGQVVITIRDTGMGIPAGALPRLFEMFSQVDRNKESASDGLGIGLALVKGLVEMHGGTVWAESGGAGQGSTFTVRLPALGSRVQVPSGTPSDQEPRVRGPGQRILVVDDHRDAARSMARVLTLLGNEVRTAHDGIAAVAAAEEFRPELILMDVGMPRLNGYEATRRIRQQPWGRSITIMALTGWGQEADRVQSREAGCDGHLVKPVNLFDLERHLSELAGRRSRDHARPDR